jgi:hypothetical protein
MVPSMVASHLLGSSGGVWSLMILHEPWSAAQVQK